MLEVEFMTDLLWFFWIYSFGGYLVERAFAAATQAERRERKCFLLLPLCPVYGLGMLAVLESWRQGPWLIAAGAAAATAVEYAVHWAYETFLGVEFWDYSHIPGNLGGRICLPFTLAWGVLAALTVWYVHPLAAALAASIPTWGTFAFLLLFSVDAVCSARFLWVTHDVEELRVTGWSI